MFEIRLDPEAPDQLAVFGAAPLPRILTALADLVAANDAMRSLIDPADLATHADAQAAEADPLARLEVAEVAADLASRLRKADAQAEAIARSVIARWADNVGLIEGGFVDVLTAEETSLLGNWANRHYQAHRIQELTDAGIDVTVGSSCGVDGLLAELIGPSPDDPSLVEMGPSTMVFAFLATTLAAGSRTLAAQTHGQHGN